MPRTRAEPARRTCVVHRARGRQDDLVPLHIVGGVTRVGRAPVGRGAWLCGSREACLTLIAKPGLLGRAFRQQVRIEEDFHDEVRAWLDGRVVQAFRVAWRSGVVLRSPEGRSDLVGLLAPSAVVCEHVAGTPSIGLPLASWEQLGASVAGKLSGPLGVLRSKAGLALLIELRRRVACG